MNNSDKENIKERLNSVQTQLENMCKNSYKNPPQTRLEYQHLCLLEKVLLDLYNEKTKE